MEEKLITVVKDGREMRANSNPDGLAELAKFGWSVKDEKAAAEKAAAEKAAAEKAAFDKLVEQCKAKDIKVTAADTVETLTKKLEA